MKKNTIKNLRFVLPLLLAFMFIAALIFCAARSRSGDISLLQSDSLPVKASKTIKKNFDVVSLDKLGKEERIMLAALYQDNGEFFNEMGRLKIDEKDVYTLCYNKKYSEKAEKFLASLSEKEFSYISPQNTLDREFTASELPFDIDENTVRLIFYAHENGYDAKAMPLADFLEYAESNFNPQDENIAAFLLTLCDDAALNAPAGTDGIAAFFNADIQKVSQAVAEYNELLRSVSDSHTPVIKMTLPELSDFLQNEIIASHKFDDRLSDSLIADINLFSKFADKEMLGRTLSTAEISALLGEDESTIKAVLVLKNGSSKKGSDLPSFVDYLISDVADSVLLGSYIDDKTLELLMLLQSIISYTQNDTALSYSEASALFGIELSLMKEVYLYKEELEKGATEENTEASGISILTFLEFITENASTAFTYEEINYFKNCMEIINMAKGSETFNASEISKIIMPFFGNTDPKNINLLMLSAESEDFDTDGLKMKASDFIREYKLVSPDSENITGTASAEESFNKLSSFFSSNEYERVIIIGNSGKDSDAETLLKSCNKSGSKLLINGERTVSVLLKNKYRPFIFLFGFLTLLSLSAAFYLKHN